MLRSKVHAILVLDIVVKILLMQNELGETRVKWVATIQEYDIYIQPMKLVREQNLAQKIAYDGLDLMQQVYELEVVCPNKLYKDIIKYLLNQKCPSHYNLVQKKELKLKSKRYMFLGLVLYKQNHEGIYL